LKLENLGSDGTIPIDCKEIASFEISLNEVLEISKVCLKDTFEGVLSKHE